MKPESTLSAEEERKRLGQYFTGDRLASLLAHLALADTASSIIDPMAGSGDMLVAAHSAGAVDAFFGALEIDPTAGGQCTSRLDAMTKVETDVRIGNAFSRKTWGPLAAQNWDLVITNPPYVRYQRSATRGRGRLDIPDAPRIREGLVDFIEHRESLSPNDGRVLRALAEGYSGLADLAVPSWLLCAALLSVGGRLAIVVPDTWLSRDYASPVLYLLRRYFELEVVVEDSQAVWFEDALVRTNLVVARRVDDRGRGLDDDSRPYVRVSLDKTTINGDSIVGALFPDSQNPDRAFAETVRGRRLDQAKAVHDGCSVSSVSDDDLRGLIAGTPGAKWLRSFEAIARKPNGSRSSPNSVYIPPRVVAEAGPLAADWRSLHEYGWSVGQGLRTGANRFFYGHLLQSEDSRSILEVDAEITPEPLAVNPSLIRPAIRKQADLDGGYAAAGDTNGRVLALQHHALPEDIAESMTLLGTSPYEEILEPLASHIRRASLTNVRRSGPPKLIPELSAVATNVRKTNIDRPGTPPRFWYQLPVFAPRHIPSILVPRVNHGHPVAFANPDGVLVDANFSTLWPGDDASLSTPVILALLNSTWVSVVLESTAAVLGGGALKVEASHLRRIPLPPLDAQQASRLEELGSQLAVAPRSESADLLKAVDSVVYAGVLSTTRGVPRLSRSLDDLNKLMAAQRGSMGSSLVEAR